MLVLINEDRRLGAGERRRAGGRRIERRGVIEVDDRPPGRSRQSTDDGGLAGGSRPVMTRTPELERLLHRNRSKTCLARRTGTRQSAIDKLEADEISPGVASLTDPNANAAS